MHGTFTSLIKKIILFAKFNCLGKREMSPKRKKKVLFLNMISGDQIKTISQNHF